VDFGFRISDCGFASSLIRNPKSEIRNSESTAHGLIVLRTHHRDTADALAEVFRRAGFATVWQRPGRAECVVRGATAGIWDGGQLSEREADDLGLFCRSLSGDAAPVIALFDFPRRDRVDRAFEIGATAVLGKPWPNDALLALLHTLLQQTSAASAA
jgi:DNA-binding response OmpR family regulator